MQKGTFFRAKYFFAIALACTACSIDIDVTDKTLNSSPLDFTNPEDFSFDANYVEIKDGKVSLKPLDLEHSRDDFARGNHVGSSCKLNKLQYRWFFS